MDLGLLPTQGTPSKRRRLDEDWASAGEFQDLLSFVTGPPEQSLIGFHSALNKVVDYFEGLERDQRDQRAREEAARREADGKVLCALLKVLKGVRDEIPRAGGRIPDKAIEFLRGEFEDRELIPPPDDTCDQAATATSAEESGADAEEASSDDVNPVEWLKLKLRRQWEDAMVGVLHERSEYINYLRERETSTYLKDPLAPLDSQLRADLMDVRETGNEFHINDIVEAKSVHEWHVALGELARYVDWCEEKYVLSTTPAGTIFLFDEERDDFVVTDEIWECIRKKGFQERCRRNGFECKRIMAEDGDIDKLKEAHTRVAERAKRLEEKAKLHRAQAPS